MFENLTCPLGPYDKNKVYTDDAPELFENIELPMSVSQEDPYGGDNCKCDCHNADDSSNRNTNEHCISCGTKVYIYSRLILLYYICITLCLMLLYYMCIYLFLTVS